MSTDPSVESGDTDESERPDESDSLSGRASERRATGDELTEEDQIAGELAVLEAENERLRSEYARARQAQYRRSALALALLGVLAGAGGLLFPTARTVLFALAGTGLFLGVLTFYLSPEQFLPATVGREIYRALAANERAVVDELGLRETPVYVPTESGVRLYLRQSSAESLPDEADLSETFVVTDETRGVAFQPTGEALFAEFDRALTGELGSEPDELVRQLRDGLVEQFELLESTEQSVPPDATAAEGELTVGLTDSAYGPVDEFDHPVPSVLGVGLARGLDTPVEVTVESDGTDRVDAVIRCRWPSSESDRPE
jgi:hypothetical protein